MVKQLGSLALALVGLSVTVYLTANPTWPSQHPRRSMLLYGATILVVLFATLQWRPVQRVLGLQPIVPIDEDASPATKSNHNQVEAQLSTIGSGNVYGDSAIQLMGDLRKGPPRVEQRSPATRTRYDWKFGYGKLNFTSAFRWRPAQIGMDSLYVDITSAVPLVGERAETRSLVAHVVISDAGSRKHQAVVARAYWVGEIANDVELAIGQTARLLVLSFAAPNDEPVWIAYSNPHSSEGVNSEWGPPTFPLGAASSISLDTGAPTIEITLIDRFTNVVVDRRNVVLTISNSVWQVSEA